LPATTSTWTSIRVASSVASTEKARIADRDIRSRRASPSTRRQPGTPWRPPGR
jgi:hypothetical protein